MIDSLPAVIDNMIEMIHSDNIPPATKAQLTIALMDRAGLQPPKGQVNINVNTLISDRARELLANRQGIPVAAVPSVLSDVNIIEENIET